MLVSLISSLVALFFCIFVGYVCRKRKVFGDAVHHGLSSLLVKVTLPFTIIVSMQRAFSLNLLADTAFVFAVSLVVMLLGVPLGAVLTRLLKASDEDKGIWYLCLMFPNVGYMGYPIISALFGDMGLFYAAMVNAAFNILAYTLGIKLALVGYPQSASMSLKSILLNNAVIATVLGLLMFCFSIRLPAPLLDGFRMIGNMTSPLSMIIVGYILAGIPIREALAGRKMYALLALRLIVIPGACYLALRPFVANPLVLGVLVVSFGMPTAALVGIFATQYNTNPVLASKLIFVGTLLCTVTLPVVSLLLSR